MSDPLYVGDVGAVIEVESLRVPLTGYAVTMRLLRPDGTMPATDIPCSVDASGQIATGLTRAGDLTIPRAYKVALILDDGVSQITVGTPEVTVLPRPSGTRDG